MCLIYNSRNYYRLLNYYKDGTDNSIYNSRNYYRLLNSCGVAFGFSIYNSRNYYRLLNRHRKLSLSLSTTVEITIGYLTPWCLTAANLSTTVEITIGYLTSNQRR